jgi:two-component system response regulator HydG
MSAKRILVVDDKLEMAEMICDALCDRGYDGIAVASAQAALEVLRSQRVDALVTDLRMPDMDGFALLAASRDLDPTLPVVLMTAFGSIDTAGRAFDVGAYQYLM